MCNLYVLSSMHVGMFQLLIIAIRSVPIRIDGPDHVCLGHTNPNFSKIRKQVPYLLFFLTENEEWIIGCPFATQTIA